MATARKREGKHATATLWMALVLGACTTNDPASAPRPGERAAEASAEHPLPELALGYAPGDARTEVDIRAAQAALREHPDSLDAHAALATLFVRRARETSQGVYRVYADDVIRAARSRGDDRRIRTLAVSLMIDEHRFAPAADAARALIAENSADPTGHLLLGDALLELGDDVAATDAYQAALQARPDLRSYNRAAYMRWLYGDFQGAIEIMDLAIGAGSLRDPESTAWCFADLGAMYMDRGDTRRALAAAERASSLVPDYVPALTLKAKALARSGELEPAIAALESALEARPAAEDYLQLSDLLERAGRPADAQQAFTAAERLATHDPRPLAHHLARHDRDPQRALELASAALDDRHDIWTHDTHALALLRNDQIDTAHAAMTRALSLGTRSPELLLHAAMIEAAAGRRADAKARLATALELDPGVDPLLADPLRRQLGDA